MDRNIESFILHPFDKLKAGTSAFILSGPNAPIADANHDTIESIIRNKHIPPPAEDENAQISRFREIECFTNHLRIVDLDEISRRTADLECRERFQGAVLF